MGLIAVAALVVVGCSTPDDSQPVPPVATGIWAPPPGTTWQWQLTGTIDPSYDVEMYDVDLFDVDADTIERLHQDGRAVVCYFSAGSVERWRPDADRFPQEVIGDPLDEWPGERWLDIREIELLAPVLRDRLDLAAARGCDGVEPDNVDGYSNATGFALEASDQLAFNRWLASESHLRGLSVGLKNDLDQIAALVGDFDWLLVEQCVEFSECAATASFIRAGKAVFAAEYSPASTEACDVAARFGLSLIFKDLDLGSDRSDCT